MRRMNRRQIGVLVAVAVPSLAVATLAVAVLEANVHIHNASIVYLTAVVATAIAGGTPGAVVAAVAAFLLYDFFFVQPLLTLTVREPSEWLGLVLLLFVGIVVGQLTALQRARADEARAREREARALYEITRELANRASTPAVLTTIAGVLRNETRMRRVWISLGADDATERVAADTAPDERAPAAATQRILREPSEDGRDEWVRVHVPTLPRRTARAETTGGETYRVRIRAGTAQLGSIWAFRERGSDDLDASQTRLLRAAADQIGQALAHDRLVTESQAAEIARQSDALKSALLQSVSHDLRTPLATIRAAAGTLRPDSGLSADDRRESAEAIDREVEYLNRLVTNLLDLSRIEAGALRAEREAFELEDLVGRTIDRLRPRLDQHPLEVALGAPPVLVDPLFLDDALTNVIDNALKYAPADAPLRISARELDSRRVRLTVEDGGPGAPPEALDRLFEKFYRAAGTRRSRPGTGIGLAVVRGLVDAMGGQVRARPSALGGLAIDIDLPVAAAPAGPTAGHRA